MYLSPFFDSAAILPQILFLPQECLIFPAMIIAALVHLFAPEAAIAPTGNKGPLIPKGPYVSFYPPPLLNAKLIRLRLVIRGDWVPSV